ncbi:MAG: ferrous iron transport protein A [Verrucomicrobiales bacterium]|nr:ferrous iron transport protein A [Verrucomicrobiales bacterium]
MISAPQPLTSLAAGQSGVVAELVLPGDMRARLLELGLTSGTSVQLLRFAPLGDPVEILVRGSHLSLRRHEAELVLVHGPS